MNCKKVCFKGLFYFLIIVFGFAIESCTSGKQALEQGDYDKAVLQAVNRLRQNPKSKKARATLSEAYPLAQRYHLDNISIAKTSTNELKWEIATQEYRDLNHLYSEIQKCPVCLKLTNPYHYQKEFDVTREKAAEVRYNMALQDLDLGRQGNKQAAKRAFENFEQAVNFVSNYKNSLNFMDEAMFLATLRVVVEPIPMHSRNFKLSNDFFQNKITEYLHTMPVSRFVKFYTVKEIKKLDLPIDQVVVMEFDDFVIGRTHVLQQEKEVLKDDVLLGETTVIEDVITYDTAGVKTITKTPVQKQIYGTAKAVLHTTTNTVESRGLLDFKILDASTRQVISQEKFPGVYTWQNQWAFFNGDIKALNKDQINLTKQRQVPPPPPQDLFIAFTEPIYNQLTAKLRDFYRYY